MKNLTLLILLSFGLFPITSCKDNAKLTVSNNLDNVTIENVNWANYSISYRLLPGQSAEISLESDLLPETDYIRFEMTAASRRIALRTINQYKLDEGENIMILVDSTLQVTVE